MEQFNRFNSLREGLNHIVAAHDCWKSGPAYFHFEQFETILTAFFERCCPFKIGDFAEIINLDRNLAKDCLTIGMIGQVSELYFDKDQKFRCDFKIDGHNMAYTMTEDNIKVVNKPIIPEKKPEKKKVKYVKVFYKNHEFIIETTWCLSEEIACQEYNIKKEHIVRVQQDEFEERGD